MGSVMVPALLSVVDRKTIQTVAELQAIFPVKYPREGSRMSQEIAVVVIHGMGSQKVNFSHPLRDEVNERLGKEKAKQVTWGEIYWADVLAPRQAAYLKRANRNNDLDLITLRKFLIEAFGDASAYRKTADPKDSAYEDIHKKVHAIIAELDDPDQPRKPLIVLAHSLGGHIMSSYIYDLQKRRNRQSQTSKFQQMKTLAGFITFGCNMPLFTFAFEKDDIKPIKFPGVWLSAANKDRARWLNFYDPDDVLGYPLKPINDAYNKVVNKDIPINVGGIFSSWNPLSHVKYWTDNDFTKPVAKFIAGFL